MSSSLGRVLIADDQVNILDALKLLLGGEGYDVATAASPVELVSELERSDHWVKGEEQDQTNG